MAVGGCSPEKAEAHLGSGHEPTGPVYKRITLQSSVRAICLGSGCPFPMETTLTPWLGFQFSGPRNSLIKQSSRTKGRFQGKSPSPHVGHLEHSAPAASLEEGGSNQAGTGGSCPTPRALVGVGGWHRGCRYSQCVVGASRLFEAKSSLGGSEVLRAKLQR